MPAAERAEGARRKAEALLAEVRKSPAAFAELARKNSRRPGLGRARRRPRLLRPRRDGQALRGCRLRDEARRDQQRRRDRLRLPHHHSSPAMRGGEKKPLRGGARRDRGRGAQAAGAAALGRGGRAVHQHGLRAVRQPAAGRSTSSSSRSAPPPCSARRRRAPRARWPRPSCWRRCSATTPCATSATPTRWRSARTSWPRRASSSTRRRARCRWPRCRTPVRERLVAEQAAALARKEGEARLAAAADRRRPTALPSTLTSRARSAQGLPRRVVDAVLRADAGKLPAVVGRGPRRAGLRGGRASRRCCRANPRPAATQPLQAQYAQAWAAAEAEAYLRRAEEALQGRDQAGGVGRGRQRLRRRHAERAARGRGYNFAVRRWL